MSKSSDYMARLDLITLGTDLNTELPSWCSQTKNLPSSSLSHCLEEQPSPSPEMKSKSNEVKSTFHIYIYMAMAMQKDKSVLVAISDFSKTFDKVAHQRLLSTGIRSNLGYLVRFTLKKPLSMGSL